MTFEDSVHSFLKEEMFKLLTYKGLFTFTKARIILNNNFSPNITIYVCGLSRISAKSQNTQNIKLFIYTEGTALWSCSTLLPL